MINRSQAENAGSSTAACPVPKPGYAAAPLFDVDVRSCRQVLRARRIAVLAFGLSHYPEGNTLALARQLS
jgi:hypothetical protein